MNPYRSLLVAYDFSSHADAALFAAMDLARHLQADCHLVHVVQPVFFPHVGIPDATAAPPPDMFEIRDSAMKALQRVAGAIENAPGKVEPHIVEDRNIAGSICEMAEKLGSDLIVMGTHGSTGISHVLLGSVAERTLRHAPCAVLTVPRRQGEAGSGARPE